MTEKKKFCAGCGKPLPADARFCADCGAPTENSTVKAVSPKAKKPAPATNHVRDIGIVVAVTALMTVAYFVFRTPQTPPEPPAVQSHGGVDGMGGAMTALQDLPADYNSLVQVGNQYMDNGNYAVAAESYRRALAIDPSDANVRTDYGACLHGMGLPERALAEFKAVLAQEPGHEIVNFNMGIVYNEIQQVDSARVYWQRYIDLSPNGPAAARARELLQQIGG